MHFSKTYAQLLLSLPPELRDNAIQYRQLKKVINQIVNELSSLGLKPELLHDLIESPPAERDSPPSWTHGHQTEIAQDPSYPPSSSELQPNVGGDPVQPQPGATTARDVLKLSAFPKVVYELNGTSNRIEPQLRIWVSVPAPGRVHLPKAMDKDREERLESLDLEEEEALGENGMESGVEEDLEAGMGNMSLLWSLQQRKHGVESSTIMVSSEGLSSGLGQEAEVSPNGYHSISHTTTQEVVIPLIHDSEFYNILSTTLESVSAHLTTVHDDFTASLQSLSYTIANSSRPASVAGGFQGYSRITTHAGSVRVKTGSMKSDLYSWREIFQLYLEAEVFESVGEASRGERTVEESEKRLQLFAERVTQHGLGDSRKFKLKQSIDALEAFLNLNLFILNIKKFSHANSEATRKILKKHAKRTALPLPGLPSSCGSVSLSTEGGVSRTLLALVTHSSTSSLPRILVQAIGETLIPVIPSVDDYSCLICTSIAFKPIRLSCGHLFCVRCLVKMQKRGNGDCPMCRAPSVLVANRSNVDWALLNFMQDWFPLEAKEKLKNNEKEAAQEELEELGLDPNQTCKIM